MNKAQLIDAIAEEAKITKADAKKALDAIIKVTGDTLGKGEPISLVGFGAFSVLARPGRVGRNPKTGAAIKIDPKKVVKFRPGAELNCKVN